MTIIVVASSFIAACGSETSAPLWRIAAGPADSYLLGTIHRGVDVSELPSEVWEAFESSQTVVTEADFRNVDGRAFDAAITLPAGILVQSHVSDEEWLLLVETFRGLFNAHVLDTRQPWFTHGALVNSYLPDGPSMDEALVARAVEEGRAVEFLETWDEQAAVLNELGIEDALPGLLETAHDPERAKVILAEWAEAYLGDRLKRLRGFALPHYDIAARPVHYERVVYDRNEAWVRKLEALINEGGAFVAVGHAHLLGDRSVVEMLRVRGFHTQRIK